MNCPKCGAPIRDGARFCPKCGAPVPAPGAGIPSQPAAAAPPAPQTPFAPAQRTADRVFPSQQRQAQQTLDAQAPNAAPPQPGAAYPSQPYGNARHSPAQPDAGIDWERLQPRVKPGAATALIWAAAILGMAAVLLLWAAFLP